MPQGRFIWRSRRVVTDAGCGMIATPNDRSPTSLIVRLMPSTAIDPFGTQ